jgi:hypothetical protein
MDLVMKSGCTYNGQLDRQLDRHLSRVLLGTHEVDWSHHELERLVMGLMIEADVFTGCC